DRGQDAGAGAGARTARARADKAAAPGHHRRTCVAAPETGAHAAVHSQSAADQTTTPQIEGGMTVSLKTRLTAILAVVALLGGTWLWLSTTYGGQPQSWSAPSGNITWQQTDNTQDSGRVVIRVGTVRDYGFRIGDIVPVQVVVTVDAGVQIDPSSFV